MQKSHPQSMLHHALFPFQQANHDEEHLMTLARKYRKQTEYSHSNELNNYLLKTMQQQYLKQS
jgi:hypothetical protein